MTNVASDLSGFVGSAALGSSISFSSNHVFGGGTLCLVGRLVYRALWKMD